MNTITKSDEYVRKIGLIGDIHGDFKWYIRKIEKLNSKGIHTIQIGDFGIGFMYNDRWNRFWGGEDEKSAHEYARMNSVFTGNHDNPEAAAQSPMFLDRFGYDHDTGIFWISGAWSIDQYRRTEGKDWWRDEELSLREMNECEELYLESKPRIVLTHDGPSDIVQEMFPEYMISGYRETHTGAFLEHLRSKWAPDLWYFGHHHHKRWVDTDETHFECIGINEIVHLDV